MKLSAVALSGAFATVLATPAPRPASCAISVENKYGDKFYSGVACDGKARETGWWKSKATADEANATCINGGDDKAYAIKLYFDDGSTSGDEGAKPERTIKFGDALIEKISCEIKDI